MEWWTGGFTDRKPFLEKLERDPQSTPWELIREHQLGFWKRRAPAQIGRKVHSPCFPNPWFHRANAIFEEQCKASWGGSNVLSNETSAFASLCSIKCIYQMHLDKQRYLCGADRKDVNMTSTVMLGPNRPLECHPDSRSGHLSRHKHLLTMCALTNAMHVVEHHMNGAILLPGSLNADHRVLQANL